MSQKRPFRRLMLLHNIGCPWSANVSDNARYDGLELGNLAPGKLRPLSAREVESLRRAIGRAGGSRGKRRPA